MVYFTRAFFTGSPVNVSAFPLMVMESPRRNASWGSDVLTVNVGRLYSSTRKLV